MDAVICLVLPSVVSDQVVLVDCHDKLHICLQRIQTVVDCAVLLQIWDVIRVPEDQAPVQKELSDIGPLPFVLYEVMLGLEAKLASGTSPEFLSFIEEMMLVIIPARAVHQHVEQCKD